MTTAEAGRLIAGLKALYPRQEVSAETVSAYVMMLTDLDYSVAEAAIREHAASARFFPTVAEIRELVAERQLQLGTASTAWSHIIEAIDTGNYERLNDLERRALNFCGGSFLVRYSEHIETVRAQFRDAYNDYRADAIRQVTVEPLAPLPPPDQEALISGSPVELPELRSIEA